jgi:sulfide:quinone oxidoreductase
MSADGARVVIAGGGIAGLEALLGLRDLLGNDSEIEVIAPDGEFVLRPLLIGEPFGLGTAMRLDLEEIADEQRARFRRGAVGSVDPAGRCVRTDGGESVAYDALLLAIGARPVESVPGAIHFGLPGATEDLARILGDREAGHAERIVFVASPPTKWTLAIYELALLTAAHLSDRADGAVELTVVTHEREPLAVFGTGSPAILRELLAEAGIELRTGSAASHFEAGRLHLASPREPLAADAVVALPTLEVPDLPGIPQRAWGFIPTDTRMNVEGMERVWAAGDATWFPIKQGGLAAQQADVAVAAIASHLGVHAPIVSYRPVLRGALLTGALPRHFRAPVWDPSASQSSVGTLWWPPGKLAGRYLTPYLARRSRSSDDSAALADLDPVPSSQGEDVEREQMEVVQFALSAADADARAGDLPGALEWLALVEEVSLVLPPPWPERRREWLAAVGADSEPAEEARL